MPDEDDTLESVLATSAAIHPLLAGLGPELQNAVLADLTATWLAGFQGANVEILRAELLKAHISMIRELVPVNEQILLQRLMGQDDGQAH
jgi:hypothetical protein